MVVIRLSIIIVVYLLMIQGASLAQGEQTYQASPSKDQQIRNIAVECNFSVDVPQKVQERIIKTLEQTLERILIDKDGRPIESYIRVKSEIEASIIKGLNIVFEPKGYSVDSLDLEFGETTQAHFVVEPFDKYTREINFIINTGNFHAFWARQIEAGFASSRNQIQAYYQPLLTGLPVNAEDPNWAFDLVKDECKDTALLNDLYPDMNVSVDIELNETVILRISLSPSGPVARTLRVRAYSRTMFQLALESMKELASSHSDIVVGMPLSWLRNSKDEIASEFCWLVSNDPVAKKLQIETVCRLYFIEMYPDAVFLELKAESRFGHFSAEVMVDVGNDENPDEFESHLGVMLGDRFEIFMLVNFFPDDIRLRPDLGIGLHLFPGTFLAGGWDVSNGIGKLYYYQYFTRDIHFEAEVFTEDQGQDQFGLVYKPFQFVSFGLFTDGDDDYWLRTAFSF